MRVPTTLSPSASAMTDVAIASTSFTDREAGEDLAAKIRAEMPGAPPDALMVFASPKNDYSALLQALAEGSKATKIGRAHV